LKPVKRRGNRRYYQHHEVLLIRRIRELLYEQGFTISGARNKLDSRIANGDPLADLALGLPPLEVDTIAIRNELTDILTLLRPEAAE
jgi:DNA-binding transcriptional MerR regulator